MGLLWDIGVVVKIVNCEVNKVGFLNILGVVDVENVFGDVV